jgi:hypothetical protein
VSCDPNTLLDEAKCFACLTEEQRAMINISLLCQIQAGGGGMGGDFRITDGSEIRITDGNDSRIID